MSEPGCGHLASVAHQRSRKKSGWPYWTAWPQETKTRATRPALGERTTWGWPAPVSIWPKASPSFTERPSSPSFGWPGALDWNSPTAKAQTGSLPDRLPANALKDPFSGQDYLYQKTAAGFMLRCQGKDLDKDQVYEWEFKVK